MKGPFKQVQVDIDNGESTMSKSQVQYVPNKASIEQYVKRYNIMWKCHLFSTIRTQFSDCLKYCSNDYDAVADY